MGCTWMPGHELANWGGGMGVHGGSKGAGRPGSLGISPPTLPPATSPPIPAGGLEYRRVFANSERLHGLGSLQNLNHAPRMFIMLAHLARSSLSEAAVPTLIAGPSSGPDPLCPRFASRSSRSWFGASQALLKTAFDNCESNVLGESTEPESDFTFTLPHFPKWG